MTRPFSPERWAFEITHVLNAAFGADRFPIDIPMIAREYTAQRFPDDAIISVQGDNLPGFDGALFKAPAGRKGWGIIYNNRLSSKGRINFTLAPDRLWYHWPSKGGKAAGSTADTVGFIEFGRRDRIGQRRAGSFTLPHRPETPWLLPRKPDQAALTRRLRSMPYRLADYGYAVSTGPLVWNRHKDQFRVKVADECFPVVWAESVTSDGRFEWRNERRNHLPWFAARRPKDNWLIVTDPCVLLQRTTAKEQPRRLIAAELPQDLIDRHGGVVVENHLNMVRPISDDPAVSVVVISALLNTAIVDAAFRCINGSVAVSAFELEQLPLPGPAFMKKLARLVVSGATRDKVETLITAAYGGTDVTPTLRRS